MPCGRCPFSNDSLRMSLYGGRFVNGTVEISIHMALVVCRFTASSLNIPDWDIFSMTYSVRLSLCDFLFAYYFYKISSWQLLFCNAILLSTHSIFAFWNSASRITLRWVCLMYSTLLLAGVWHCWFQMISLCVFKIWSCQFRFVPVINV